MIIIWWLQQIKILVLVFMFFPCLGLLHSTRFDVPAFRIFAAAALKYALTRELCHAWTVPIFGFLPAQSQVSHSPNKEADKGFYQSRIRIVVAAVPKLDGVVTSITHWSEFVGSIKQPEFHLLAAAEYPFISVLLGLPQSRISWRSKQSKFLLIDVSRH